MADYTDPDVLADIDEVEAEIFDSVTATWPAFTGKAASGTVVLARSLTPLYVEQRILLAQRAADTFDFFGEKIARVPRIQPVAATASLTWVAGDTLGHTVDEDTQVSIGGVTFAVVAPAEITAGTDTVTGVQAAALDPGSFANDLTGDVTIISREQWMLSATLEAPTVNGDDGETTDEYIDRLARRRRLGTLMPIMADQWAELTLEASSEIVRVVILDGYDNIAGTDNNPRTVTIVAVDTNGLTPSSGVLSSILTYVEPLRGANWTVYARGAWYTTVDADYTARALPGYDPVQVKTAADAAVADVLDPRNFGLPQDTGDPGSPDVSEVARQLVPIGEIYQAVESVTGIDYCSDAKLATHGGTLASASLTLTGRVALPVAGTITGTVAPAP